MEQSIKQLKCSISELVERLQDLGTFYYWANEGNLGDLLIAEATRQLFECEKLSWKPYHPDIQPEEESYVLVYGGGGRFTNHWGGIDKHLAHLTSPRVRQCIILPHSFYRVDSFLQALDYRHTIFCRGESTFCYVRSTVHPDVSVQLADDMALSLNLNTLPSLGTTPPWAAEEEKQLTRLLQRKVGRLMRRKVWHSTVRSRIQGKYRKIAFLLRTDKEKNTAFSSPMAYDISLVWSSSCAGNKHTPELVRQFAAALQYPDVIVTDRLHVGVLSLLCGKEVYLLDNDYKKLSDVYQLSMQDRPGIHLLDSEQIPQDIQAAFHRLSQGIFARVYLTLRRLLNR
ncbi:MAG: polysaccharide pyruvyl transferase family protein [Akkermansia sp.]|nr:polysaccharide pyruvyl transferase family protein [Akkermansia sp.]